MYDIESMSLGDRILDLGFGVQGVLFRLKGLLGFRVWGLGFRV